MIETWQSALEHLRLALEKLDHGHAPPEIGAHVDIAICRLQDALVQIASAHNNIVPLTYRDSSSEGLVPK